MEFLVRGRQHLPPDMPAERQTALRQAEGKRANELIETGLLKRIWRVPGETGSWQVREATDATELHEALASVPLFPWYELTIYPLGRHPKDPGPAGTNTRNEIPPLEVGP